MWINVTQHYCKSLNQILESEAQLTECLNCFMCRVIEEELDKIKEVDKRICIFKGLLDAYNNRTCVVSKLISSSECLLEGCDYKCYSRDGYYDNILDKISGDINYNSKCKPCLPHNCGGLNCHKHEKPCPPHNCGGLNCHKHEKPCPPHNCGGLNCHKHEKPCPPHNCEDLNCHKHEKPCGGPNMCKEGINLDYVSGEGYRLEDYMGDEPMFDQMDYKEYIREEMYDLKPHSTCDNHRHGQMCKEPYHGGKPLGHDKHCDKPYCYKPCKKTCKCQNSCNKPCGCPCYRPCGEPDRLPWCNHNEKPHRCHCEKTYEEQWDEEPYGICDDRNIDGFKPFECPPRFMNDRENINRNTTKDLYCKRNIDLELDKLEGFDAPFICIDDENINAKPLGNKVYYLGKVRIVDSCNNNIIYNHMIYDSKNCKAYFCKASNCKNVRATYWV